MCLPLEAGIEFPSSLTDPTVELEVFPGYNHRYDCKCIFISQWRIFWSIRTVTGVVRRRYNEFYFQNCLFSFHNYGNEVTWVFIKKNFWAHAEQSIHEFNTVAWITMCLVHCIWLLISFRPMATHPYPTLWKLHGFVRISRTVEAGVRTVGLPPVSCWTTLVSALLWSLMFSLTKTGGKLTPASWGKPHKVFCF